MPRIARLVIPDCPHHVIQLDTDLLLNDLHGRIYDLLPQSISPAPRFQNFPHDSLSKPC